MKTKSATKVEIMKTFTCSFFSILLFILFHLSASAAIITVTNTNNSGAGSLRQAIITAASGDEIVFSNAINGSAIILDSVLTIATDLTITGNGMQNTIIDGGKNDRVIWIETGVSVSMSGLIVQNGEAFQNYGVGGGINSLGNLTMTNCWVRGNSVIYNMDPAFSYGGGIRSRGDLVLINCIVSGNSAYTLGGGIYSSEGDITLINTTVVGNSADDGAGVHFAAGTFGDLTLRNCIVWANEGYQNSQVFGIDIVTNSIVQDIDLTSQGSGNLDGTDPANDPNFIIGYKVNIPNTGGDYRIMENSNLIDAGNNTYNTTSNDIYGVGRTFDGDLNGTSTIDIGAVEFNNYPGMFITQWDTRNPGTSADNQITIPTALFSTYNYTVHWGDGTSTTTNSSTPLTHTYAFAPQLPIYNVVIEGTFPRIYFNDGGDKDKILAVLNWGDNPWTSMVNAFMGCSELTIETSRSPNLSVATELTSMFQGTASVNGNLENWEVNNIESMAQMFEGATNFNGDIEDWDVSNVLGFTRMFKDATSFNRNIGGWIPGSAIFMGAMFQGATAFNRDIGNWDVGNVQSFTFMFEGATNFNQDIGDWDVSSAKSFGNMFQNATSFDQDLGGWDISSLEWTLNYSRGCRSMFEGAGLSLANYDNLLIGWNRLDPGETQIPTDIHFHGGSSQYCAGEGAHMELDNTHFWTFTDSGSLVSYNNFSVETCSTYTVPSGNATYTVTGTYQDTIPNAAGCDSILSIDLTILNSNISYSVEVCESYTVPSGDETYTESGIYMDTIPNTVGCDSILTIDLTVDGMPPTAICQDITVHLDMNGVGSITVMEIDGGSTDNCGIDTLLLDQANFDCSHVGVETVTLTVTDNKGNSSSCTSNVTVVDTIPPMAICQDITLSLDANGDGSITANDIDAGSTDNCGIASMSLDTTTFDCSDIGDHSVTLTVFDDNGNSSSCVATVTVVDDMPPTLECQDVTVYLDESGTGPINPFVTGAFVSRSDNCGMPGYIVGQVIGVNCSNIGDNTLFMRQPDLNGNNSDNCYYTLTIADTISPMAVCQDITVNLDANGEVTVPAVDVDGGSTDNCDVTNWTLDQSTFDCTNLGSNPVVLTVSDQSGNSNTCSAIITVEDITPPTPICQDVTISLDENGNASLTAAEVDGGSFDNCSVSTISLDRTSFSCADLGDQSIILTVIDGSGNASTCMATVTAEDNIAPTVSCSADVTLNTSSNGTGDCTGYTPFMGSYSLNDNCPDFIQVREIFENELGDTLRDIVFDLSSGSYSPVMDWPGGKNKATFIPIDGSGNMGAACSYNVTIIDDEAPVATCQDITLQLDENGEAGLYDYSVGEVNGRLNVQNEDYGNLTTDCDCPNGFVAVGYEGFAGCIIDEFRLICKELLPDGSLGNTTAVTCFSSGGSSVNETHVLTGDQVLVGFEVSDVDYAYSSTRILSSLKGIGKSLNQILDVQDNMTQNTVMPGIIGGGCFSSSPSVTTEYAPQGHVIVGMSVNPNGVYTPAVRFRYAPISNMVDVNNASSDNCAITNATVSPSMFNCSDVGPQSITYTVWDRGGNSSSCNAIVTVEDNVPPIAICQDATIYLDENGEARITAGEIDNGSADSCGIDAVSLDQMNFVCSESGQNEVVLTVTDVNGNSSTCTAIVTVWDTISPIVVCQDITVQLDENGEAEIDSSDIDNGSFDNCDISTMELDITTFDCSSVGSNTVILTVTDESGNSSSCTASVMVEDNIPPTPICQDITIELDENGEAVIQPSDVDNGSFDNCEVALLELNETEFDCSEVGSNTVELTVTDVNGNTSSCNANVMVEDNVPPTPICQDVTVQLDGNGQASIIPSEIDNGSFDNCDVASLELDEMDFDCSEVGENTVELTVTDVNGNTASCNATVTVEDNIPPVVLSVPADITLECDLPIPGDEPVAEDNCEVIITHQDVTIPGSCTGDYMVKRTFTVVDPSGNEAAFKPVRYIQFIDTKVPYLISAPQDETLACGTVANLTLPVVQDNCDPDPEITYVDDYREDPGCPQGGRIDRTFTISDDCGNSYVLLQQFYFYDDVAPVIEPVHPDLIGLNNGETLQYQCFAQDPDWEFIEFTLDDFSFSDNCSNDIQYNITEVVVGNGDCMGDGYLAKTKYTVSADDRCGNTSSFEFYVELIDEIPPVLHGVPSDLTISCEENYSYPSIAACAGSGDVYAVDECECVTIVESRDTLIGSCPMDYSVMVSYTATDNCGNTSTGSYMISVEDNDPPALNPVLPELANISNGEELDINCDNANFPDWVRSIGPDAMTAEDNCGSSSLVDYSESVESFEDCFDNGALAIIHYNWEFEDECGNTGSFEFKLRLVDNEAPVIQLDHEVVCAEIPVEEPEVGDNCGEVVSLNYEDEEVIDNCSGENIILRTWTAVDHCGNIGTAQQQLISPEQSDYHFEAPFLQNTVDGDTISLECTELSQLVPTTDWLILEDGCFGSGQVMSVEVSESGIDSNCLNGSLRVDTWTWQVESVCGEMSEIEVFVNVSDQTAPELADFEDEITLACGESRPIYQAEDVCSGIADVEEVSFELIDGDTCQTSVYERMLKATDLCGNEKEFTQMISIEAGQGPEITGIPGAAVCDISELENVSAFDHCINSIMPVEFEDVFTENCGGGRRTLRVYRSESFCGTESRDSVYIINNDQVPPDYQIVGEGLEGLEDGSIVEIECTGDGELYDIEVVADDVVFSDACDPQVEVRFQESFENGNCEADGYWRVRKLMWEGKDACGNVRTVQIEFRIVDTQAPEFLSIPEEVVIFCGDDEGSGNVIAVDECSDVVEINFSDGLPQAIDRGTLVERTWTASDGCGNSSSIVQNVIYDNAGMNCQINFPIIVKCDRPLSLSANVEGGVGPYTFNWYVTEGYADILSGQGSSDVLLDLAFSNTEITLLVEDQRGCISSCSIQLSCDLGRESAFIVEMDKWEYHLYQNVPNPFANSTIIGFELPEKAKAQLVLYDNAGKKVYSIEGEYKAGYNEVQLKNSDLPAAGMYYYEFNSGSFRGVKQFVLIE